MIEPSPPPIISAQPNDFSCAGASDQVTDTMPTTKTMRKITSNPVRFTIVSYLYCQRFSQKRILQLF